MRLISEQKTYRVAFDEAAEYRDVPDTVKAVLSGMPEWSLVCYSFDADTWEVEVTVRRGT